MLECGQYFILEGKEPRAVDDATTWRKWLDTAGDTRIVARTLIGEALVSTTFIGLPPSVFQTLVWGGRMDGEKLGSSSWAGAAESHEIMVARVRVAEDGTNGHT
jgi:hypothetical protein